VLDHISNILTEGYDNTAGDAKISK